MQNVANKTVSSFVLSLLESEAEGWTALGGHNSDSKKPGGLSFSAVGYGVSEHSAALSALKNAGRFDEFDKVAKIAMLGVIDSLSRQVVVDEDEEDEDQLITVRLEVW